MKLQRIYFVLTLIGTIVPIALLTHGMFAINWQFQIAIEDLTTFLNSFFGHVVITWLFVTGASLSVFAIHEAQVRQDYYLLWVLPVIILFGIGAALPLYLYLRTPKRDQ